MSTESIRRKFLDYFKDKGHTLVPSSPVVPHDDPTLLFNNAGMNQFKDVFLGKSKRDYTRAASSQKCVRVGGKHNDLENVGHTSRHLTFFEMLGNFSFGDYFKEEAIAYAWEVSTEIFGFAPEKIWPTVFTTDDEAFEIWTRYVPAERITRFGESENFWAMGDTGPCGPCSELYYDRGPKFGPARSPLEDEDGERYLEFWNLVFMQSNKDATGTHPLPKPSIDTGSGLERVMSLIQGVDNLFATDILRALIAQIENLSGKAYVEGSDLAPSFCVIADHLRTLCFAIADGVQPSNVDRGYVLRKILRRAVRYGKSLGFEKPFLAKLVPTLIMLMGGDYPELKTARSRIEEILTLEEESFLKTLKRGGHLLQDICEVALKEKRPISGEESFKLKDTYGFPLEEIQLLAKDYHLDVDLKGFEVLEKEAKERSKKAKTQVQQIASENLFESFIEAKGATQFLGYEAHKTNAHITAIVIDGQFQNELKEGQEGMVILDNTVFYAEKGGQVGDTGALHGSAGLFEVSDCQEPYNGVMAHLGTLTSGALKVGEKVRVEIDEQRRADIARNHSATHLLHWALIEVLGEHVRQAGSVVDSDRLRFDFSHHKALSDEEILQVERLVNEKIRENKEVTAYEKPYAQVQGDAGIKQFFGDKYGHTVRVVDMDFSKELCGGTHCARVGDIGYFRILKEGSIAAGVRRIEATSGRQAENYSYDKEQLLSQVEKLLQAKDEKLLPKLEQLIDSQKQAEKDLAKFKEQQAREQLQDLYKQAKPINGKLQFVSAIMDVDPKTLRSQAQNLPEGEIPTVTALACQGEERCQLIVHVPKVLWEEGFDAKLLAETAAVAMEGSGGGKKDLAQAGGKNPKLLPKAFAAIEEQLAKPC